MGQSFAGRLKQSPPLIGMLVTSCDASVAEALSYTGFDWLFLDAEHGPLGISDIQNILRAVGNRCAALVRIAGKNDEVRVKQAFDTGCDGVIVPAVNTAEETKNLVKWAKYPPDGARSVGIARAHRYGMGFSDYIKDANTATALIVQIETAEAVKNIKDILSVKGIDGIFIGAYDLSASMGLTGEVAHPDVVAAIQRVKDAAAQAGTPVGIFVGTAEAAKAQINSGVKFVAVGIDMGLLQQAAQNNLKAIKA